MTRPPDLAPQVAQLADRPLGAAEFLARVRAPLDGAEREEALRLHAWFVRRYPSAGERLAYVRRKYAEWNRRLEEA